MTKLDERYRVLLSQYQDPPKGNSARKDLEAELSQVEHLLIENPPGYRNERGQVVPRAKGLVTAEEARAGATSEGLEDLHRLDPVKPRRIRDDFRTIPVNEWRDRIAERKRLDAMSRPLVEKLTADQDGFGSCASEGISGCVIACEAKQGNEAVEKLNGFRLYRYVNGGRDGGSSLSDNVSASAKYGTPTEKVSPRSRGWRTRLSDDEKQDALRHRVKEYWRVTDKEEFGTALLLGMFVYAGYSGHAWYAVDPVDDVRFTWHNSWSKSWADKGFSTLRYSKVMWGYGAYAVRTALRPSEN